jgi:hypothetical protein
MVGLMRNAGWRRPGWSSGRQAAAGQAPFAALVVQGGEGTEAGVSTVEEDLPGQGRRGATPMSGARLARPFTVFAASGGSR